MKNFLAKNFLSFDSFFWFSLILFVSLLLAQIIISIKLSTQGKELAELEDYSSQVSKENQKLKTRLASFASLPAIASSAAEMGFVESPQDVIYLSPNVPRNDE